MVVSINATGEGAARGTLGVDDNGGEGFLELSMLRAVGNVRIALVILMLFVVTASLGVATSRTAAFLALFIGSILAIWTRFAARWRELYDAHQLSTAAGIVLIGDVLWIALFVFGTGGSSSPFLALLFIPLVFGCAFFSVLKLAAALVAGLITFIIVGMSVSAPQTAESFWRTSGTIFAAIAVTWVAYGLARVLERERRTNELVVRHMSEAVMLVDGSGVIRLINPPLAELTGLDEDDLVGSEVEELPNGAGYALLREIAGEVLSDDRHADLFRDIEVKGETPRDLRIYTVRMGGGTRPSGWVIICQDVTDLKSLARARESGVRFLSHEMRSPLNTLKIVSQIFGELTGQLTGSNAERLVAILDSETDRMLRMVGQFLDLAALDQGTFRLDLEEIRVNELLERVCESLKVRAADKELSVEKDVPATLPPVKADADRLEDVLHNLCDNALKYTDRGGHIRIYAIATDHRVELHVSDDGRGIAPEIQSDIFSEFVRATEDGQSGRKMGVGLGLYLARRIIEEHGGEITVQSTIGVGSDFKIALPAV